MVAPVRVGDVLAEKYEITRILGEGGMGVVVAAKHRELDKLVALKFMHEEFSRNGQALDRFLREARAAARLTNEHVGRVLDVARLDSGVPYIVMEYLEGRDLGRLLEERGPLDVADVCEYVLQTCEAMAEAHAQGVIHRDLKPQNLFLTMRQDGRPLIKVLDFGISKVQFAKGPTATNTAMGTATHMSPEQMRSSRTVDPRADIWSLGVILYQLLSGKLPFEGETFTETMLKVIGDPPPSLAEARPGLPGPLVAAVEKCLEKERDDRFDNVAELAHALTPYAPERARAAISLIERVMSAGSPVVPRSTTAPTVDDGVVPSIATTPPRLEKTTLGSSAGESVEVTRPRRSQRWVIVVAGACAVVAIAFAAVARHGGSDTPAAPIAVTPDAAPPADAAEPVAEAADAAPVVVDAAPVADAAIAIDAPRTRKPPPLPPDAAPLPPDAAAPSDAWRPEPPRMGSGLEIPR